MRLDTDECYYFGPNEVDYITASKFCLTRGLRMAEILSDEDQTNLEKIIRGTRVKVFYTYLIMRLLYLPCSLYQEVKSS